MTRTEYNRTVDHFSDGVYRFILKMCKSKEMAEDVVQDSFMKLWEDVEHIAYDKAKSFLFSTSQDDRRLAAGNEIRGHRERG